MRITTQNEAQTLALGRALGAQLPPGTVIALVGTLGAGKTALARGISLGAGVPEELVSSPTFMLVHEYPGTRLPVYHFDAYRVADDDEFLELGAEDYFYSAGLSLVEWADRVTRCLPPEHLRIEIRVSGADQRQFDLLATSAALTAALEQALAHFS